MIRYSDETTKPLLQKMFRGCTLQEFLDAAEDITVNPLCFVPAFGNTERCTSRGFPPVLERTFAMEHDLEERGDFITGILASVSETEPFRTKVGPGMITEYILCWAIHGKTNYGLLSIAQEKRPLDELDQEFILFLASCAAQISATQQRPVPLTGDELLGRLLRGEVSTALHLGALPNVGKLLYPGSVRRLVCLPVSYEQIIKMGSVMLAQFRDLFSGCWCAWNDEALCVLLDVLQKDVQHGGKTSAQLIKLGETFGAPVCVGPKMEQVLGIHKLCRHMMSIPTLKQAKSGALVYYHDHMECSLIYEANLPSQELQKLCSPLLAALKQYDDKNGTEYLRTLKTYLSCHLNASQTARALFIHPNTAIYRLNRMQELFDFDLLNANTLFNLMLPLRIDGYIES